MIEVALIEKVASECIKDFYADPKNGGPVPHDWALDWFGRHIDTGELTKAEYEQLVEGFYREMVRRGFVQLH